MWDLTSSTRDQTHTPCIERQSHHHWTTRENPPFFERKGLGQGGSNLLRPWWVRSGKGTPWKKNPTKTWIPGFPSWAENILADEKMLGSDSRIQQMLLFLPLISSLPTVLSFDGDTLESVSFLKRIEEGHWFTVYQHLKKKYCKPDSLVPFKKFKKSDLTLYSTGRSACEVVHVNPWLIHVNIWQKPLQYSKVISLQLMKVNGKKMYPLFNKTRVCIRNRNN